MAREARLQRIHALQGVRAGFVSRVVALALDFIILGVIYLLILGFVAIVRGFHLDKPHGWFGLAVGFVIAVLYFGYLWTATGRSVGEQFFGLRTVRANGDRMRAGTAYVRSVLWVLLPIFILWIPISRRNDAVQDIVCRTAVTYDWSYHPPAT
jgi:uncharacterized RDD family membrane protein YckC